MNVFGDGDSPLSAEVYRAASGMALCYMAGYGYGFGGTHDSFVNAVMEALRDDARRDTP